MTNKARIALEAFIEIVGQDGIEAGEVSHSEHSVYGASAYTTLNKSGVQLKVRCSDHSTGVRRYMDYHVHITGFDMKRDIIPTANEVISAMPEQIAYVEKLHKQNLRREAKKRKEKRELDALIEAAKVDGWKSVDLQLLSNGTDVSLMRSKDRSEARRYFLKRSIT